MDKSLPNECPGCDIKVSYCKTPEMLELLKMWSTSLLPLIPGSLEPRSGCTWERPLMAKIELFDMEAVNKQMTNAKLHCQK